MSKRSSTEAVLEEAMIKIRELEKLNKKLTEEKERYADVIICIREGVCGFSPGKCAKHKGCKYCHDYCTDNDICSICEHYICMDCAADHVTDHTDEANRIRINTYY